MQGRCRVTSQKCAARKSHAFAGNVGSRFAWVAIVGIAFIMTAGCGSLLKTTASSEFQSTPEEDRQRQKYQTDRDPDALRWLLKNRVRQGMALSEINLVLGEDGRREADDSWIKNDGGVYRQDDDVYKWGPDADGQSIYLVFRDDCLTNYDPKQFGIGP